MKSFYLRIALCISIATVLALTSHIYISDWVKPALTKMMEGLQPADNYSAHIIVAAYATAFITVSIKVFLYYHAGHLLNISNKVVKIIILAIIVQGDFFRQPFMDYLVQVSWGMKHSLFYVFLNHIDKWIANLLFALCLVYLCPTKHEVMLRPS